MVVIVYLSSMQVITGYLLAGSVIGPGGFSFVSELVQVSFPFMNAFFRSDMLRETDDDVA